jgi:pyruvate dehydrogenase E2 component (dihydrolipoamide acetyltransferase)
MAANVTMPQLSDTMNDGKILSWLKKEGDEVQRGDALAEVATDKADLEIESFHEGVLLKIYAQVGSTVEVGSVIATIGEQGERVPEQPKEETKAETKESEVEVRVDEKADETPEEPRETTNNNNERTKISPLAKNFALNHGVDFTTLVGTGEGGRIVKRDIEKHIEKSAPQEETKQIDAPVSTEPLSTMRQTIAKRMVESMSSIPHFYVTTRVVMDEVAKLKDSLKPLPQYQGITYNHLILKAAALALRAVPSINARYENGNLVQSRNINIGIITAVNGGLLVPVLKHSDKLPLADIVSEGRSLVQRARSGRPKQDDLTGGTFSISNMGIFSVESFTAIINPGQGAILAISAINEEPIVVNSELRAGLVMRATLSVDHRIIDGVIAGEFLTEFTRLLQDPVLLLA